jgi:hypothetical protein
MSFHVAVMPHLCYCNSGEHELVVVEDEPPTKILHVSSTDDTDATAITKYGEFSSRVACCTLRL